MSHHAIIDLYKRHARDFDRDRSRGLQEGIWLDLFLGYAQPGGTILDIGCGMGEPIARYMMQRGFDVVGVDSSPTMIALCRERFPQAKWSVADMRTLALDRCFDGILAWDSFFHLHMDDQHRMFRLFATYAFPRTPLMFTSGVSHGERIGSYDGEPLYHASLDRTEYEQLLTHNGFSVRAYRAEDPDWGGHTVWLATHDPS